MQRDTDKHIKHNRTLAKNLAQKASLNTHTKYTQPKFKQTNTQPDKKQKFTIQTKTLANMNLDRHSTAYVSPSLISPLR